MECVEVGPEIYAYANAIRDEVCDRVVAHFEGDPRKKRRDDRPAPRYENRHGEMLFVTKLAGWEDDEGEIAQALAPVLDHHYFTVMTLPRVMTYDSEGIDLGVYRPPDGYCEQHFDGAEGRITSVLIYLNTVEVGGETVFPRRNLVIPPVRGTVLVFLPTYTHLHYARMPISGPRYYGATWVRRTDGFRQPYDNKPAIQPEHFFKTERGR